MSQSHNMASGGGQPPRRFNPFGPGGSLHGLRDRDSPGRGSPQVFTQRGDSPFGSSLSPAPSDSSSEGGRITVTLRELRGKIFKSFLLWLFFMKQFLC